MTPQKLWLGRETVYRLYQGDRLLYVGQTRDLVSRLRVHEKDKWWYPLVTHISTQVYPDRDTAYAAEQQAIRDEHPEFNVNCAGGRRNEHEKQLERLCPEERAMAEAHNRLMFVRHGIDPDTLERLPRRMSPAREAAWAAAFPH